MPKRSSDDSSSSPKRVCAEDLLTCPLCADEFRWPAIGCNSCHTVFCEECISSWGISKNGGQEQVPCPNCRSTQGFERNDLINRHVGQRRVSCPSKCGAKFAACDRDEHLNKHCEKRTQRCPNASYGCNWSGTSIQSHTCIYTKLVAAEHRFAQQRAAVLKELTVCEQKVELLKTQLQMETVRCETAILYKRQELELYCKAISANEQCREFIGGRHNDKTFTLFVTVAGKIQAQLHLRVQLNEVDSTYQLYGSLSNAKSSYPVAFYCLFINQSPDHLNIEASVRPVCGRFSEPKKELLMFSERDTLLPKHGDFKKQKIHFRISFTAL